MYIIQIQNFIMTCEKYIFMNTIIYQILKKKKMDPKYSPTNLLLDEHDYSQWYKELDNLLPL